MTLGDIRMSEISEKLKNVGWKARLICGVVGSWTVPRAVRAEDNIRHRTSPLQPYYFLHVLMAEDLKWFA